MRPENDSLISTECRIKLRWCLKVRPITQTKVELHERIHHIARFVVDEPNEPIAGRCLGGTASTSRSRRAGGGGCVADWLTAALLTVAAVHVRRRLRAPPAVTGVDSGAGAPCTSPSQNRSTEYVLAVAVATYADAIGVPLVASKNGAYSSARVGAAYKRMGVRAGFPDLNIPKVGGRDGSELARHE